MKISRWRNSIVHGIQDGDRELLGEHDLPFCGADDLSDSSDEEEQATPPTKRLDDGGEDEQPSNSDEQPAQPASEIEGLLGCQCSGGTR